MDGARQLAHGVGHEAGLTADLGLPHVPFQFGLGNEGGHGVDHDHVDGAGADQHVGDLQGLLAVVGLRDEQVLGFDPEPARVIDVEGMLGVDESRHSPALLGLGDDVQGLGGLA